MNRRQSIFATLGLGLCGIPAYGARVIPPRNWQPEPDKTFVEISGRQTGKSTRMRYLCAHKLQGGERVCIHTWMPEHVVRCLKHLVPRANFKLLTVTDKFDHVAKDAFNVYDDWDQAAARGQKVPFIPGGYYSTTLSHLRDPRPKYQDELFRQLMEACDGKFLNFMWTQKQIDQWAKDGHPLKLQYFGAVSLDPATEGGYLPYEHAIEHTLFD